MPLVDLLNLERNPADAWYMLALSIRQPYAELIPPESVGGSDDLRGVPPRRICDKTIEHRSRPTRLIGQRFYI